MTENVSGAEDAAEVVAEDGGPVETGRRADNFRKIMRREAAGLDQFQTVPVRQLYKWWLSFQPNMPARQDFDIARFWKLAPSVYIIEVLDKDRFLYRLNGEQVVQIVGTSMRGHEITPDDPLVENRLFLQYLQKLVKSRVCWRCSGKADVFGKGYLAFETVDCPIADENGAITHVIGVIALINEEKSPTPTPPASS